jgi:c-di-GMP-binding flagellar brake protein YcgR
VNPADRRRFARIEASLACTVATESETAKAQVVNLSRTGVALLCQHSMETGEKITLLIENPKITVGLTGEIVRKAAIAGELSYGVRFDPLPPQADEELVELLRELAAGKGAGRRAFPRVAARVAVICKTRESFQATLSDLSQGGLKVRCPKPVAQNMVLELALGMPGATGLLTLHGDVRHCEPEGQHFSVGVKFAPVSEDEKKAVTNLLEVLLGIADPPSPQ